MANKNGNDSGSRTPDTVVCELLKIIKKEEKAAESSKLAGETTQQSKEVAKGYKICCLSKAEESNRVYQDMMSCISIGNFKKTEIAQKNIEAYIKKDDDIEKLIKESSKLLNDLRVKIDEANTSVCLLRDCLDKIIPPAKANTPLPKELQDFKDALEEIVEKTNKLQLEGKNAFDSAVVIAGIQTFTNTASLKDFATSLMEAVKLFKECVVANITSTATDVTKAREDLNKIMEDLAISMCEKNAQFTTSQGLQAVIKFICECECDEGCIDLCKDFDECCKADDGNNKESKKSGKPTKDQN